MAEMYLVLIETSGNQNYIFSTNKLKENIGASELTYRAGTQWVIEAVDQVRDASEQIHQVGRLVEEVVSEVNKNLTSQEIRNKLLDTEGWNRPIEPENDVKVEVVIATSGKALLLTKDKDVAKAIIRYVTHKATRYAPGLDISGVISRSFDWNDQNFEKNGLRAINEEVHHTFEMVRSLKPSPVLRFLRLPILDECSTSGLPAHKAGTDQEGRLELQSIVSLQKRKYSDRGLKRFEALLEQEDLNINFAASIRALNKELMLDEEQNANSDSETNQDTSLQSRKWLAVVHADGNGLGEIFLKFGGDKITNNREYIDKYRKFSIALEICTEKAFREALNALPSLSKKDNEGTKSNKVIPLVPLVLGGDDLTVVCDGSYALQFTCLFLQKFEEKSASLNSPNSLDGVIPEIAQASLNTSKLSACAGIAIVKPHFPFSSAYNLAEELLKSAKQVKDKVQKDGKTYPCSALDFHVLYDSSEIELDNIRKKLVLKQPQTKLYGRPYIVTPLCNLPDEIKSGWVTQHEWQRLNDWVVVLKKKDDGKRQLPNSQMHDLREGLFLGQVGADARLNLIWNRYKAKGLDKLVANPSNPSLFWKEDQIHVTGFLDAMDAVDFWGEDE